MDSMGKLAWGGRMEKMIRNTDTAWMFGTEWAMLLILVAIGNMWWLSERRETTGNDTQQGCKVQKTGGNPMWDDAILLGITKSPARATPKRRVVQRSTRNDFTIVVSHQRSVLALNHPLGQRAPPVTGGLDNFQKTGREPLMVDGIRLVTAGDHQILLRTNHCAPILEVLKHPNEAGWAIIVMPLLRSYDKPCFDLRVRNCMSTNIMMGGASLYHILFHPIKQDHKHDFSGSVHPSKTCTQHLVKYYLTDFNLSRRYKLEDHPPLEATIRGRDQTAPKIDTCDVCTPFPANVYYLGNLIWHDFLVVPHLYSFPISNILQSWDITSQKFGFEFM
ncbi:hypothetical protein B0H14DRAFT_2606584 [Mycena olivaceomarginata]|nr:hypothetical protein B0H14DRAFT_2606584 [Mycena olivaceomarginata]